MEPLGPPSDPSSPWVQRFADLVPEGGPVLDLACGGGRHARWFLERGHPVTAVGRDVRALTPTPGLTVVEADLETGAPFPFALGSFAGVVVTNYLWRPILAAIVACVAPGGTLLYETFAMGNERFGRPSNPDFLLASGELLDAVRAAHQRVVAYEDIVVDTPRPAAVQRIAATCP